MCARKPSGLSCTFNNPLFRLRSEVAQGVAFGTSSHVIGTSRATEMSQLAGAVSSLSLTLAGIITCIALSFLAQYI